MCSCGLLKNTTVVYRMFDLFTLLGKNKKGMMSEYYLVYLE